jgi:threonine dehydrogenase-like Zn-dependent dehydrogenase
VPRELIASAPRTPALRWYDEPDLGPGQIRVRTEFASPKHGTELVGYRNDPAAGRPYSGAWGAVMPAAGGGATFPRRLGNMAVGTVTEAGDQVSRFRVGDRVFGHFPIRETQTVDEWQADPLPAGMSAEAAVCLDPVVMAMAMRDVPMRLGDNVSVFGIGAIGLMAVQLARLNGADWVVAVDPIAARRELALTLGADVAVDPVAEGDTGLAIRKLTYTGDGTPEAPGRGARIVGGYSEDLTQVSQLGVDIAYEASGSPQALHDAIRSTRFGGTVCVLSFYGKDAAGLHLGEEFHINRLTLVSARAQSLPLRDAPASDLARLVDLSLKWLADGRLKVDGIVTPVVDFADSVEAYREIDEHPERSIKLGIRFP